MWSVVILSPTLIQQEPEITSVKGTFEGGAPIFGPLLISSPLSDGKMNIESSTIKESVYFTLSISLWLSLGSLNSPIRALHAAVSGLTRYTLALLVPLLPSKFLLLVLRDTPSVPGDWWFPMQKPQALSRIRAPAFNRVERVPSEAIISSTALLPGAMPRETVGGMVFPSRIFATFLKS